MLTINMDYCYMARRVPRGFWSVRQERRRHNQFDWARHDNEVTGSEPHRERTAGYD